LREKHLFHYDPLKSTNLFHNAILHSFLQTYGQLQKETFQDHMHGNEHFQNSDGCGLMVIVTIGLGMRLYIMKFIQEIYNYIAENMESSIEVCAFKPLICRFFFNPCAIFSIIKCIKHNYMLFYVLFF
jgi:hypothetical protein